MRGVAELGSRFGSETSGRAHRGEIHGCHCQGMQMCCLCCRSPASHCAPRDAQCCVQPCGVCGGGGDPQHSFSCSSSPEEPFCCCRFSFGFSLSIPMEWQGSTAFLPRDEGKPRVSVQGARWKGEIPAESQSGCCFLADRWQCPGSSTGLPELQLLLTPVMLLYLGKPLCVSQNLSLSGWREQGQDVSCRCAPDWVCGAAAEQVPVGGWWWVTTAWLCAAHHGLEDRVCYRMHRTHMPVSARGKKFMYVWFVCTVLAWRNKKKVMQPPSLYGVAMSPGHTGCAG